MMDFNINNKEKCFNYSVISEQMIGTLYKVRKQKPLKNVDYKHLKKGQEVLNLIIDGKLLEIGQKNLNLLSNQSFFIYDYGSIAIKSLKQLNQSEEIVTYLKELETVLENIEDSEEEEIKCVEDFFSIIGELLDKDIEELKYTSISMTQNIFTSGYQYN